MSRTNRRKDYYARTFNQIKNEAIKDWETAEDWWKPHLEAYYGSLAKQLGMIGTDTKVWGNSGTQSKKWHSNRELRTGERRELTKCLRDWEYEFSNDIDERLKRLSWAYD